MRFVRARTPQGIRVGVLRADGVVQLSASESRLDRYFGGDGEALQRLGESIRAAPADEQPLAALELITPVDPTSMRDFLVFEEHVLPAWRSFGMTRGPDVWYEQPIGYFSNAANLLGPRDAIEIPGGCTRLDFELEVGAIMAREVRSATPAEAEGAVAGFLVLCDWSARDLQWREMDGRLGPYKGKDFGSSLGPVLVTPDELVGRRSGKGYDLLMTSAVNGREYGHDVWSSAAWSIEEIVSFASWNSVVEAGALLGTGTCQGGCILELSLRHGTEEYPWLAAGDVVQVGVELMGEIIAPVTDPGRGAWPGTRTAPPAGGTTAASPPSLSR
jgi:2-keto-4-pentenoate hydratase/2-oxohepta-3-ene-1,7-dioic acid hydratase in catechol pathway